MGNKCLVLLGTLDTKGEELLFLKHQIEQRQCNVIMIDVSMGGEPLFQAEVAPQEIAKLGGISIEEIRKSDDRSSITLGTALAKLSHGRRLSAARQALGAGRYGQNTERSL